MTMDRREALQRAALLLGYAVSGTTIAGLAAGCSATPAGPGWTPVFLTPAQAGALSAMADHLLPASETPGARDVGVDRFIDAMVKDYCSTDDQKRFTAGLDQVDTTCRTRFGQTFAAATSAQKDEVFREFEAQSPSTAPSVWGAQISDTPAPSTFYRKFKELALVGYYTSEPVGRNILRYDPLPGRFTGCVPLSDGDRLWTEG